MAIYIKFDGIEGNCKKTNYEGWIECSNWSWGGSMPSNVGLGEGAAKGTVQFSEINISCVTAGSSLLLLHFLTKGKHFDKITLDVTKAISDKPEEKWMQLTLEQGMISSYSQSTDEYSSQDNVGISFGKYTHEVWEQDKKGALKSAGTHGFDLQAKEAT